MECRKFQDRRHLQRKSAYALASLCVSNEDDVADMVDKEEKMKGFFANVESLKKYWDSDS